MPSGGHGRSGPAPDPNALRRDRPSDAGTWTTLPAKHQIKPPVWPLTEATERETELWKREWKHPQAAMWQKLQMAIEVAMYVRSLAAAESMDAPVAARTLVRQMMDSLGLTVPGMRTHRWKIAKDEVAAKREQTAATKAAAAPARTSSRTRLTVVPRGNTRGA